MARLEMGAPPAPERGGYAQYRPWLDYWFYRFVCAYCGLHDASHAIDHYEPQKYAPGRVDDPTNLLLGCGKCNGRGGKSDYHPLHARRTRLPHDRSGFHVVDPRSESPAALFRVEENGQITARAGAQEDRAIRNIVLLKLNQHQRPARRRELMDLADACERLVGAAARGDQDAAVILQRLLPHLARRLLFFHLHDLPMSPVLLERAEALRHGLRSAECAFSPRERG